MTATSPRTTGDEPGHDRGATLVELLVVLAILGLSATLGATGWLTWRNARALDDSAGRIVRLAGQARVEALRQGKAVTLSVNAAQGTLAIPALSKRLALPPDTQLLAETAAMGDAPSILFLPDGSSTGAMLTLSRPGHGMRRLRVSWADGSVRREP
ncbi:GspH/FimT family pseudopilin [Labrys wisconsinensis]|uniref:Type II secretion system protein H n=1 Tax=Labrys wisconsinensis TaxID=425677 RepID=A0ABU0JGW0_9HYPH|nr:GspH/FimT family pseudopilin [Labrys wisconsinensis]MDQ0473531.1 general secretion pathway protein H [Labrys wisconsinensis]